MSSCDAFKSRPSLVVAHPGHELRLFGWVAAERPTVHILTAGARHGTCGRVGASAAVIAALGAVAGTLFGEVYDRDLYAAILCGSVALFHHWIDTLRDSLVRDKASYVVVDAWELYNVAHDLTHVMARIAAVEASLRLGRNLEVYDYAVVPRALAGSVPRGPLHRAIALDPATLDRKLATAHAYPDIGDELTEIAAYEGRDAIAREELRCPPPLRDLAPRGREKPPYESYGEQRVAAGLYQDVVRWPHVAVIYAAMIARLDASARLETAT